MAVRKRLFDSEPLTSIEKITEMLKITVMLSGTQEIWGGGRVAKSLS